MGPALAIRTGFAKSFQVSGRATRPEFWWFAPPVLAFAYYGIFVQSLGANLQPEVIAPTFLFLFAAIPAWTAAIRRLHDAGRSCGILVALLGSVLSITFFSYALIKFGNAVCGDAPECDPFLPSSQAAFSLEVLFGLPAFLAIFATPWLATAALLICCQSSQPGTNPYGPNPSEASK